MAAIRFAFAGDRDLAVWVLRFLVEQGAQPLALLVSEPGRATHAGELAALCPFLDESAIIAGADFRDPGRITQLEALGLDYLIAVHFPYVIPAPALSVPRIGVVNLHPAYLPFNRGWHTPSWAILDGTPVGATLHFMDQGIDTGDIIHQKSLDIDPGDTADSLYRRIKQLELEVFREAWPLLKSGPPPRTTQTADAGTHHRRQDLAAAQPIDLDAPTTARDLLRRLRALTTSQIAEAACFDEAGKRYRIQVTLREDETHG